MERQRFDETINFKISSETKNALDGIAKIKQLTLSDLVREAIDKYMRLTYFGEEWERKRDEKE